jgi:hypothetical protein
MPNTFELIASSTVGSGGAANIEFTSIPATFTDLCLKWSGRSNSGNTLDNLEITFNNSTSSYTQRLLYTTNGTSALSASGTSYNFNYLTGGGATASTFSNCEIYIPNYAGSANKSYSADMVTENNATAAGVLMNATLWSNTAAISSIKMVITGYNHAQYSTAYLYGVKNA